MHHARFAIALALVVSTLGCLEQLPLDDLRPAESPSTPTRSTGPPGGRGTLTVHFIDVGQGDSILVETPGGNTLLMDAGDRSSGDDVIRYLRDHGVARVDVFVASHGDADHIGGAGTKTNNVIDAFPPKRVYEPGYPKTTATYETFLEKVDASGAEYYDYRDFDPGSKLALDPKVDVTFIGPSREIDAHGEPNDEGIILRVSYGNFSVLLPGDAGAPAERAALATGLPIASVVLKVGHHGSRGSSSEAWLNAVAPEIAIVSVSGDNPYGHPHPEAMDRLRATGATIYRTDVDGSVKVTTDGVTWSVETHA